MCPLHPCVRLLCPGLVWHLGLVLLVGLSACGPAPSDQASNLGGPSESQPALLASPSSPHDGKPLAAPLASNPAPTPLPEQLVLPQWIAQALDSPKVSVRLQALDRWAEQGSKASLDPLVLALDDEDDAVRTKAMALIERQWAVEPDREEARGEP